MPVQDTEGVFAKACKDQGGSRMLQEILERSTSAEVVALLQKIRSQLFNLMRVRLASHCDML